MVGDEESSLESGVLTSPNYPDLYLGNHDSTQTVQVAEGNTIRFVWTNFHTEVKQYDYVEIVDEDGTVLVARKGGSSLPSPGISNTNIMHVKFHTDGDTTRTGWRLEWTEQ